MIRKLFAFKYIAVFYALLIFVASTIPQIPTPWEFKWGDKAVHFIEYGIFSLLLFLSFFNSGKEFLKRNVFLFSILIGLGYGLLDEIHQKFVPGRSSDIFDFLADGLGILLVQAAIWFYLKRKAIGRIKSL